MRGVTVYSDQTIREYEAEKIKQNIRAVTIYHCATQTMVSVLFLYAIMAQNEKECCDRELFIPVILTTVYTCLSLKRFASALLRKG